MNLLDYDRFSLIEIFNERNTAGMCEMLVNWPTKREFMFYTAYALFTSFLVEISGGGKGKRDERKTSEPTELLLGCVSIASENPLILYLDYECGIPVIPMMRRFVERPGYMLSSIKLSKIGGQSAFKAQTSGMRIIQASLTCLMKKLPSPLAIFYAYNALNAEYL
jgi:hypothetical protein